MSAKLRVAVLFGGRSGEHAVSLMSAAFILRVLDPAKYDVVPVGISRQGDWWMGDDALELMQSGETKGLTAVTMLPDPGRPGLASPDGSTIEVDVFFPVLHGTFGEDGTLQGLLEMAGAAYVGAGVLGSAAAMDKSLFQAVMQAHGIPTVETQLVLRSEMEADMDAALDTAEKTGEYPLFVKPANLGSSVGISKAASRSDLMEGLMDASQYDRRVIVQKGYDVREIEVSVLGNDHPEASVCGEILPAAEFYSYDAKYHDDRSKAIIPADIPANVSDEIRSLAVRAYKACDLAGLARVDFFLEKGSARVYINEINTMPGFTEISMFPMLWEASGLSNQDLVDRLIELALERKADREKTSHQFERSD